MPDFLRPAPLTLLLALGLLSGCPEGDDDDTTVDDDDDDDDDDGDDDDATTPPAGVPMTGNLRWSPNDGALPAGAIRVGLFRMTFVGGVPSMGEETFSDQVTKGGLTGNTLFTVYVEDMPGDLDVVDGDTSAGVWVPFAYADSDASGGFNAGDGLIGTTDVFLAYIADEDEDLPGQLAAAGAGLGWNTVTYPTGPASAEFVSTPLGTNSTNGPEILSRLIPVAGGTVPLTTSLEVPAPSRVAAWWDGSGTEPAAPQMFLQAVSNNGVPGVFADWAVGGAPPPADHLEDMGPTSVALYQAVVWYDGTEDDTFGGQCDLALGLGVERILAYVEPPGADLDAAFALHVENARPGWKLIEGELNRPLASGMEIVPENSGGDDDDDSAGGDFYDQLPDECRPVGDDDDSAGDDDDSAGDDDDSAP